jgi:hypothetical protein
METPGIIFKAGIVWVAAIALYSGVTAAAATENSTSTSAYSVLDVPITVDLASLFGQMEQLVPHRAGTSGKWEKYQGLQVQYDIRRGPIQSGVAGNRLQVTIPLAYRVRARKSLAGILKIKGSCGYNEPPRVVILHLETALHWGKDWNLLSETRVYPNRFLNPCLMTIANLDVTPLIDRKLNKKLIRIARQVIDEQLPGLSNIETTAMKAWSALQAPVELDNRVWLQLNPKAVHVTPLHGEGTTLASSVAVTASPNVRFGPSPVPRQQPFPRLLTTLSAPRGLQLDIETQISTAELRREIEARLTRVLQHFGGTDVRLNRIHIGTQGRKMLFRLEMSAPVPVAMEMTGSPAYDRNRDEIFLEDFDLRFDSDHPGARLLNTWLAGDLRGELEKNTSWPVPGTLAPFVQYLEQDLKSRLARDVDINIRLTDIDITSVVSTPDLITLRVRLDGAAHLHIAM